jgi:superfamily II DNA or RNA helicase
MPKAIISNRIYMDLPEDKQKLFDALTFKIVNDTGNTKYQTTEIIRMYKMITPQIISIPQGRLDLIPKDYEIVDKRIVEFADFPAPKFELFPEQKVVFDAVEDSAIINALVGWGKSFFGLHMAVKYGQKTLIIVHTAALRDQWVEEVEKLFGFKPGIIAAGIRNLEPPIVIGNVQSVVKVVEDISKVFGTVIVDEMHHTPASTFSSIIDKLHCRYRIGLSGTMIRKDGKHVLFPCFFGHSIHRPPQNNTLDPKVQLLKTKLRLPPGKSWADRVTGLMSDKEYQEFIAGVALIASQKGHKVLVIGDRVDFLQGVAALLPEESVVITGETKNRKELIAEITSGRKSILCGSTRIFSEGISINCLSYLLLGQPIASEPLLEQLIGRVMRLSDGKLSPVVLDIQFAGHTEKVQSSKRLGFYLKKGWKMENI